MQAANTGLTGGSTPDGDDYDREIVIISTMRMKKSAHPGRPAGHLLSRIDPGPARTGARAAGGAKPHSLIGSSCLGASVFGGICNNSGDR